jgi:hypothetical protein
VPRSLGPRERIGRFLLPGRPVMDDECPQCEVAAVTALTRSFDIRRIK